VSIAVSLFPTVRLRRGFGLRLKPIVREILFQPFQYPVRVTATVKDGSDARNAAFDSIVYREGKPIGEQTVATVVNGMNAGIQVQGVDIGPK
jgi:hypothetical protein